MRGYRVLGETAEQRSARFSAELDAVERMAEPELRREIEVLSDRADFLGFIARTVKHRCANHCGRCPYPAGCVVCTLPPSPPLPG